MVVESGPAPCLPLSALASIRSLGPEVQRQSARRRVGSLAAAWTPPLSWHRPNTGEPGLRARELASESPYCTKWPASAARQRSLAVKPPETLRPHANAATRLALDTLNRCIPPSACPSRRLLRCINSLYQFAVPIAVIVSRLATASTLIAPFIHAPSSSAHRPRPSLFPNPTYPPRTTALHSAGPPHLPRAESHLWPAETCLAGR